MRYLKPIAIVGSVFLFAGIGWDFRVEQIQDANRLLGTCSGGYDRSVLDEVVQNGGDIDSKNCEGATPLMESASWNNINNIRLLLLYGANFKARDSKGKTALDYANRSNSREAIKLLQFFAKKVNCDR